MKTLHHPSHHGRPARQRGAALFVAMMILILLSLLAISASQVTTLQEKMVQAYWADVRAFEAAEERLRVLERTLWDQGQRFECPIEPPASLPPAWASSTNLPTESGSHYVNLSRGELSRGSGIGGSLQVGGQDAAQCAYFLLSSSDNDARNAAQARSWAVVQSVFVP